VWHPSESVVQRSHLRRFQCKIEAQYGREFGNYEDLHRWSISHPECFWFAVWDYCGVVASEVPDTALSGESSIMEAEWFPGARLNFAENLLRHRDDHPALVAVTESGGSETITYRELFDRAQAFAAGLEALGVEAGDRVGGVMPNVTETVVAMLGTVTVGAVWTCCSPDFGVEGILDRFGQTLPKVIVACEAYSYNGKRHHCVRKLQEVADALPDLVALVLTGNDLVSEEPERKDAGDHNWVLYSFKTFCALSSKPVEFRQLPFDHPVYILYSSGTTGKPKCLVHGAGGTLLQHLKEYVIHYDVGREDTFFYYTTTGWTMWNILASALLTGCKVVLYDGSPFFPGPDRLVNLIDDVEISVFGVSAKYIAAVEKAGLTPLTSHSLEKLRMILSTGSPLSKESYDYVYRDVKEDVCLGSICGGTDIISAFIEATYAMPVYSGFLQCKGLGMAVEIWDENGNEVRSQKGDLVCSRPFPSRPVCFWGDRDGARYRSSYFERFSGVWAQGDFGEQTTDGQFVIYGRSDAILNPGGVRIGTAEIYRQVEQIEEVLDSVCVGQQWGDDVRVVLFVVLRDDLTLDAAIESRIRTRIRENTTPRHVPAKILQVTDIPRTISGKNVEIAVRDVIHGEKVKNVESLANPEALDIYRELKGQLV
jgi:acetoacetyl-CoA synthetase